MKITKFNEYSLINKKLIYLAVPYTAKDLSVQATRAHKVTVLSARLVEHGIYNFSPITQSHQQQISSDLPHTWDFWENHDTMILDRCDELWVYMLPGWTESKGVLGEIEYATSLDIPVRYVYVKTDQHGQSGDIEVYNKLSECKVCPT